MWPRDLDDWAWNIRLNWQNFAVFRFSIFFEWFDDFTPLDFLHYLLFSGSRYGIVGSGEILRGSALIPGLSRAPVVCREIFLDR